MHRALLPWGTAAGDPSAAGGQAKTLYVTVSRTLPMS
jgi:hypothetical protein